MKTMATTQFDSGICDECGANLNEVMDLLVGAGVHWERSDRMLESAETDSEIEEALAWKAELVAEIQYYQKMIKVHCSTF